MGYAATHGRKCAIVIPHTLTTATLTDFPVCFNVANLPSEMFDADGSYPAKSDGSDVRFSSDSAGDTPMNVEVERFGIDNNPANGFAEIWVRIPSFSYSVDTTVYVWYNDPDATAVAADDVDEGSEGVWNSNFFGVYHLSESANDNSGNYKDATANDNHLTGSSMAMTAPAGAWSGSVCAEFDGSADYLSKSGIAGLGCPITISAWVYRDATEDVPYCLSDNSDRSIVYGQISAAGALTAYSATSAEGYDGATGGAVSATTWTHCAGTFENSTRNAYVNGAAGTANTDTNTPINMDGIYIGVYSDGGSGTPNLLAYWDGKIDDARFSSVARSAAWLAAEYAVINSIASITAGTPGSPSAGTTKPWYYYAQM